MFRTLDPTCPITAPICSDAVAKTHALGMAISIDNHPNEKSPCQTSRADFADAATAAGFGR